MKKLRRVTLVLAVLLVLSCVLPGMANATPNTMTYKVGTRYMRLVYSVDAASIYENPAMGVLSMPYDMKGGSKVTKLGGLWDRDYLYLAYDKQAEGTVPEVTLNGVQVENITVVAGETQDIIRVPFAECDVIMDSFGYTCDLSLKLGDASWNGYVTCITRQINEIKSKEELVKGATPEDTGVRFIREASDSNNMYHIYRSVDALASSDQNITTVLEFDVQVNTLPMVDVEKNPKNNYDVCYGLEFLLTDESNSNASNFRNGFNFGIANSNGSLVLVSNNRDMREVFNTGIPASRKDTLHFRVEYDNFNAFSSYNEATEVKTRNNATARYYINGVLVGIDKDCKSPYNSTTVQNSINIFCPGDGKGRYDVYVGNIRVEHEQMDPVDNNVLNELNFQSFKGDNLSVNGINSDLQLPQYAPGGMLNGLKLEWTSNNESAITAGGKVTSTAADTAVELTASVVGMDATKTFFLGISDDQMTVPGTKKEVKLDGELTDRGWAFVTEMTGSGNPISMGGLWTDDYLYIGCEKIDTTKMTLIVNGKVIENVAYATGDKYTEMQIPLADVGLTAGEGTVCPITIFLGDVEFNGQFTFGAKDTSVTLQDILLYVLIGVCVIFVALLVLAIVLKLYKKIWFIIILVVVLVGGVVCAIFMNIEGEFDDGSSKLPGFSMPTGDLASKMPVPQHTYGNVLINTQNNVVIEILKVSPAQFAAYVDQCRVSEFYDTSSDMDACYMASNDEDYVLSANYVENEEKMYVSIAVPSLLTRLTYENIRLHNPNSALVTYDVRLPETASNGVNEIETALTWSTSDPTVIGLDGKVTRPDFGLKVVTLTATIDATGEKKIFTFRVPGYDFNKGTLVIENDINPAGTPGKQTNDVQFTLDKSNNSIITDLGEKQKVNYVKVTDIDDISRLNTTTFSIWGSNDNLNYTRIDSFKLMQVGKTWYLYDFETEARYIKLHYGLYEQYKIDDISLTGGCGEMIRAGYEEVFGGNGAEFKTSEYTLTNLTGKKQYDYAWTISKNDLGITGTNNSVRIYLGNELLYHYVNGDNVVVRVPEVDQGASVTLKVMSSDSAAPMDISNKEYVYEVSYGSTEVWHNSQTMHNIGRYNLGVPAGTKFPNGTVQEKTELLTARNGTIYSSTDGGYTWEFKSDPRSKAPGGTAMPSGEIVNSTGMGLDPTNGRIFVMWGSTAGSWQGADRWMNHIIYSDDGGFTWSYTALKQDNNYASHKYSSLSYSDIYSLSTHDGTGPNVDLIFPAIGRLNADSKRCSQIAYSRDGGATWEISNSVLTYGDYSGYEMGATECNVIERHDGVLVLLARVQTLNGNHFAMSYSTDHGVTWTTMEESSVYAVNTQPVMTNMVINGEQVKVLNIPGHNAMGDTSYLRAPLVFASTTNGETFRNIQNIFSKAQCLYDYESMSVVTNTSFAKYNDTDVFISWNNAYSSTADISYMRITDFDKWFTRTKGAYDSFEHGTVKYEDWDIFAGAVSATKAMSTDGNWSMHCERITSFTRNVPYLQDGKISFNIYVCEKPLKLNLELQSALHFNEGTGVAPVGIEIDDNVVTFLGSSEDTGLTLQQGWNTIVIDLELSNGKAAFQLNGSEPKAMPVDLEAGDYICQATFNGRREFYMDEFMVSSDLDSDVTASQDDLAAANAVIEQIKAMGSDAAAVDAAKKAYEALTVVQKDFVNCRYYNADGTYVNYYDLLMAK